MIIAGNGSKNYMDITKILGETCLRYIKNDSRFKDMTIGFFIRDRADIFMSHGCADKNYREIENCKYLHNFKLILVPGPWLKYKLISLGIHPSKIACVGWPKIDPLFLQLKYHARRRTNQDVKRILWAPTHTSGIKECHKKSISSNPGLKEHLELLNSIKGLSIVTSEHPKNRNRKTPTLNKLVTCDYVIADSGSTIYEAWALGKPVIFPDWIVKESIIENVKGSAEEYIYNKKIGYHANNIDELIMFLKSELVIEKDVADFMEAYMPSKFNGLSGQAVSEVLVNYYEKLQKQKLKQRVVNCKLKLF